MSSDAIINSDQPDELSEIKRHPLAEKWRQRMIDAVPKIQDALQNMDTIHPDSAKAIGDALAKIVANFKSKKESDSPLSEREQMVLAMVCPTATGHRALSRNEYPEIYDQFLDIAGNAFRSDDEYVQMQRKKSDTPFIPRVIAVDDVMPAAFSVPALEKGADPFIIITTAMMDKLTPLESANVLRHELRHAYRQARPHHIAKELLGRAVTANRTTRREEKRADLFAPRNPKDLVSLASALDETGDMYEVLDTRMRDAFVCLQKAGLLDDLIEHAASDAREQMVGLGGNNRFTKWVAKKAGGMMEKSARKSFAEIAKPRNLIELDADGNPITTNMLGRLRDEQQPTHPSIRDRCEYLQEAAELLQKNPHAIPSEVIRMNMSPAGAIDVTPLAIR